MLTDFLSGAIVMGFAVAALFFLKLWRRTQDALFGAFAIAFGLLGLSQLLLTFTAWPVEERSWLYLIRLAAFLSILVAVWHKNRGQRS
jgi:membrane-associated PAP2 superfamily phosphatase